LVDEILDPQFATTIGLILYGRNASAEEITDTKDFNKILKDFSVNSYTSKLKEFIKQFLP
jgi:cell division ATPase FtsA